MKTSKGKRRKLKRWQLRKSIPIWKQAKELKKLREEFREVIKD